MNIHDETMVISAIKSIQVPHTVLEEKVLKKVASRRRRLPLKRALAVLTALFISAWAFIGAGVLLRKVKIYNLEDGTFRIEWVEGMKLINKSQGDIMKTIAPFFAEIQQGELRVAGTGNMTQTFFPNQTITDFDGAVSLLAKSELQLKLPSYVPDGYKFARAVINYYLPPEYINIPLIESKNENGIDYQIYELPEDYANHISSVQLQYDPIDESAGYPYPAFVYVQISYSSGNTNVMFGENDELTPVEHDCFDNLYLVTSQNGESDKPTYFLHGIIGTEERIYMSPFALSSRNLVGHSIELNRISYSIGCNISGEISKDDLMKMAESIGK